MVKLIETEHRIVFTRGGGEGSRGACLMGIEFQICKMKKSLEICFTTA